MPAIMIMMQASLMLKMGLAVWKHGPQIWIGLARQNSFKQSGTSGAWDKTQAISCRMRIPQALHLMQLKTGSSPQSVLQIASPDAAGNEKLQTVAGYWKHHQSLTTVVIKDAGHMVPRDQPFVAQTMIEAWVQHSLGH